MLAVILAFFAVKIVCGVFCRELVHGRRKDSSGSFTIRPESYGDEAPRPFPVFSVRDDGATGISVDGACPSAKSGDLIGQTVITAMREAARIVGQSKGYDLG